jgi:hypothetical protein
MKKALLAALLFLLPAISYADDLDKYIELLRSDMRTKKVEVLTEALQLTSAEGEKFWPIQREYETELAKIQDRRVAMLKDYEASFESMTDQKATEIMKTAFKLEDERNDLVKKYTGKISKDVSPRVAARFAQCEKFIQSLTDVAIRGEIPLHP